MFTYQSSVTLTLSVSLFTVHTHCSLVNSNDSVPGCPNAIIFIHDFKIISVIIPIHLCPFHSRYSLISLPFLFPFHFLKFLQVKFMKFHQRGQKGTDPKQNNAYWHQINHKNKSIGNDNGIEAFDNWHRLLSYFGEAVILIIGYGHALMKLVLYKEITLQGNKKDMHIKKHAKANLSNLCKVGIWE